MPGTLTTTIKQLYPIKVLRHSAISAEARWFDWRHKVQTRADHAEEGRDWTTGFPYLPTRPRTARRILRSLPIVNHSDFTLVDVGSGKGRMLLVASEFPFRKVVGVEMRQDLHDQALENVRRYRHSKARRSLIECRLVDATHYDFPDGNLVVYLFNPFSAAVMSQVLRRIDESFEKNPREIIIVYLYPESGFLLKTMRHFQIIEETFGYFVAKSHCGAREGHLNANYTCAG